MSLQLAIRETIPLVSLKPTIPMKATTTLITIVLLILCDVNTSQSQTLTEIGAWKEGVTYGMTEVGDVLCHSNGTYIDVIDITDRHNPRRIGRIDTGQTTRQLLSIGTALYQRQVYQIVVFDMSDPTDPVPVDTINTMSREMIIEGDKLYSARTEFVDLFDLSDPLYPGEPTEVSVPVTPSSLSLAGDDLFMTTSNGEVYIYNITDPENPVSISTILLSRVYSTTILEDRLYIAGDSTYIYDISDIGSPIRVNTIWGFRKSLAIQDDIMYAYDINARLFSYDMSDRDNPVQLDDYWPDIDGNNSFSGLGAAIFKEDQVFLADAEFGVYLIDISDPANLSTISRIASGGFHDHAALTGDQILVSSSAGGLYVIDVSNPEDPVVQDRFIEESSPIMTAVIDDIAFVVGNSSSLWKRTGEDWEFQRDLGFYANKIAVDGDRAYIRQRDIAIFDISDPTDPLELGRIESVSSPRAMLPKGDTLFVGNSNEGVEILDVSDPSDVVTIGHIDIEGYATTLVLDGTNVLAGMLTNNVHVIDLSDPASPVVTMLPGTRGYSDFARVEGHLIGLDDSRGIYLFDESADPMTVSLLARVPSNCENMQVDGNLVYALSSASGLRVFRFEGVETATEPFLEPASFAEVQIYPNPFSLATNVRFETQPGESYTVSVHDLIGRLVRSFGEVASPSGKIEIQWDGMDDAGRDAAPGLYIIRFKTMDSVSAKRVVKVR